MSSHPRIANRYPLRHPDNTNLSLHYDDTFEGFPVMIEKGPFIREYLARLKHIIDLAIDQYPRVLAFRVDLRLPKDIDLPDYAYTNQVISKFFEAFTSRIEYHRSQLRERSRYTRGCKVRYVWARETGRGERPHYHLLILLNRDAYYGPGRLRSEENNIFNRMQEAWASALGIPVDWVEGLVEIPDNPVYRINRSVREGREDQLPALFHRASYLCKAATKSYGDRQRGFDTSRG
ncbi:inovirus Gp2 family protein [Pseudomonas aeruginosa]|nr:inovirus Gp2 family protein [Pseudomonas aeruginosa]MBG5448408.1 inovirus Gp2 family protein [Pseudomonas aeruginosa]MBG5747399.1 inovirus Gp2 family protein [Pseudomonas aeruginosa]